MKGIVGPCRPQRNALFGYAWSRNEVWDDKTFHIHHCFERVYIINCHRELARPLLICAFFTVILFVTAYFNLSDDRVSFRVWYHCYWAWNNLFKSMLNLFVRSDISELSSLYFFSRSYACANDSSNISSDISFYEW